jgi:uncharacterized paraquat-inducible protein A
MTSPTFAQRRCRNHMERQAACRCPGCGFDFCRECVTEHDERLLCSRCIATLTAASAAQTSRWSSAALGVVGIVAAWIFFFLAGELVSSALGPQHEVRVWHAR